MDLATQQMLLSNLMQSDAATLQQQALMAQVSMANAQFMPQLGVGYEQADFKCKSAYLTRPSSKQTSYSGHAATTSHICSRSSSIQAVIVTLRYSTPTLSTLSSSLPPLLGLSVQYNATDIKR